MMRVGRHILALLGAALLIPACGGGGSSGGGTTTDASLQGGLGSGQPPFVRIISPTAGSTCHEGATVNVQAVAMDADTNIVRVEFFDDSKPLGSRAAPPFTLPWNRTTPGSHLLTAVAFDVQGLSSTSAPVTVFVVARGDGDDNRDDDHGQGRR
jgi:hypothetical protein